MKRITITSVIALIPGLAWATPSLSVDGECGSMATVAVDGLTGSDSFYVMWGDSAGSDAVSVGSCAGTTTDLDGLHIYGSSGSADSSGSASFVWRISPGFCGRSMQIIDRASCEVSNRVMLPASAVLGGDCDYTLQYWNGESCVNIATDYNAGYADGSSDGYEAGYADAFSSVDATYEEGYEEAYATGFDEGVSSVSLEGYYLAGFDLGYDDGFEAGISIGETEGANVGFGFGSDDFYCEGEEPPEEEEEEAGARLRIQFQGYAYWEQDVSTMSDWDQDAAMAAACGAAFDGSTPLSLREIVEGRTRDMPTINDSGTNVVAACGDDTDCYGDANDAAVDGHNRQCVSDGWAFPERIFPPSVLWNSSCGADGITTQAAVCVTYEEVDGVFVVAEGRQGGYGQELWILDPYTGDTEIVGDMSGVPVTGMSYDEYGNLWYVQASGWSGAPEVGIMDPYTGEQEFLFYSANSGAHSGFTWTGDRLFFWSESGDNLHEMDPLDGSDMSTLVYGGSYDNGICTDYEGNMYRTTGYDTWAISEDGLSEELLCGSTIWPGTSGADCTFHEGEMYMIGNFSLWHMDLTTCTQTDLGISLPDGADALAGLP